MQYGIQSSLIKRINMTDTMTKNQRREKCKIYLFV